VDVAAFEALVERQVAAGVAGLVTAGTTGEAATLRQDEIDDLVARTVRIARGKVMVLAGVGTNDTHTTDRKGAACGNRRSGRAARRHALLQQADASGPARPLRRRGRSDRPAGHALQRSRPLRHRDRGRHMRPPRERHANVVAIKEAGGSVERVTRIRRACGRDFPIHSGDDALTLPFLAAGAVGVTSVVSNVAPKAWWRWSMPGAAAMPPQRSPATRNWRS
jgi:4-hydroxy-tetrahydrodipicolinate synthase